MSDTSFQALCDYARETALLESVAELLEWDERTKLPPAAGEYRADQITLLTGMVHRRKTASEFGDWLAQLESHSLAQDPHSDAGATIRQLRRAYDEEVRLPQRLVEELTRASVLGQQAWSQARQSNNYADFAPHLEQIVRLKREQADAVGYAKYRYDALLDDFEPDATTDQVAQVLAALRDELVPLIAEIGDSGRQPNLEIMRRPFPVEDQADFGRYAASCLGFDFTRGRLDVTTHPFCSSMGPHDCRITTRYDERFFPSAFYSILHEAGHGMYDQGLRSDQFGLPPGTYVSLGIHESQSRLWENSVGRSRAFWEHFFPEVQRRFSVLSDVDLDQFWFAVNDVRPSLIRVEADEATYNLHIIVRFELEQALINDDLAVKDLPAAWNDKYQSYLGVTPPDDANGVLQDIHWSAALIGYFPTYSLGNLYAAQFFDQAEQDIGPLDSQFRAGQFEPLLQWLRERVHHPGQCYPADELATRITSRPLGHASLLRYLRSKYSRLYGIDG